MSREGALLTQSHIVVAEALDQGQVASITFGSRMYALFSRIPHAETMVDVKDRGPKPFTLTTAVGNVGQVLANPRIIGLPEAHSYKQADAINKILTCTGGRSIGVLYAADPNTELPQRMYGQNLVSIEGQKIPKSVSIMTPGNDPNYEAVLNNLPTQDLVIAGSSNNRSGSTRDGGSGNHRLAGVVEDFGHDSRVAIHVPSYPSEAGRNGPSSTTYFVGNEGQVYLMRAGDSTPEEAVKYIDNLGLDYAGTVDNPKVIKPFDYEGITIAGVPAPEAVMAVGYSHLQEITSGHDVIWTPDQEAVYTGVLAQALTHLANESMVLSGGHV